MKKILALALALAMLVAMGGIAEQYPIAEGGKLSYAVGENAAITAISKWADTPFIKALQEQTGIELELVHPSNMNVYIASGDCADIVYSYWNNDYPGGVSKAIDDGVIADLTPYLEDYAPDYLAYLDANPVVKKSVSTSDGRIATFNMLRGDPELMTTAGIAVRSDWLEELGMEAPETAEEFYEMLVAFRDQKGATAALTLNWWWLQMTLEWGMLTSPFGLVNTDFYQVDGVVHYGYAEESYKQVLEYLKKLYDENLLDHTFLTIDDTTEKSNMLNGVSGAIGVSGGGVGSLLTLAENGGIEGFDLCGISSLVANKGEKGMYAQYQGPTNGGCAAIMASSQNIELACQFLNYGYTEAGHLLYNFGIEGESYNMVEGIPTYTDFILHNSNGWTVQQAMGQYLLGFSEGPYVSDKYYILQYYARPQQAEAVVVWADVDAADYAIPMVSIPENMANEFGTLSTDISTFVHEQLALFITGERSLDTFDEYLKSLDEMGIARYIEIKQTAYDEFVAR